MGLIVPARTFGPDGMEASASTPGAPHSGTVRERKMPELSDVALFVVAVLAVWLTRRALRRRMRKGPPDG
ncbi:hypothetical protein [Sphingomonas sp. CL5.1]|uniref:hypothetical protein n=1 Tax=Sphingomonas sp. CL5.1 TaxID=2653203 RepID=UPI001C2DF1AB|nr:hypothetical protein [Sphingomonas sp. CL5.1]